MSAWRPWGPGGPPPPHDVWAWTQCRCAELEPLLFSLCNGDVKSGLEWVNIYHWWTQLSCRQAAAAATSSTLTQLGHFSPQNQHMLKTNKYEREKKNEKKRETAVNKKTCHWSLVQSRQPAEFHVSVTAVSLIWCAWYFGVESSGIHRRDHRHSASVTNRVLKSKNILKRSDRIWFFHSEEVCSEELWLRFCLIFCTWWENSTRDKSSGSQLQTQQHCHLDHLRKQNKRATWWQWMSGYWFCLTVQRSQVWSPVMRSPCIDVRFYFKACK